MAILTVAARLAGDALAIEKLRRGSCRADIKGAVTDLIRTRSTDRTVDRGHEGPRRAQAHRSIHFSLYAAPGQSNIVRSMSDKGASSLGILQGLRTGSGSRVLATPTSIRLLPARTRRPRGDCSRAVHQRIPSLRLSAPARPARFMSVF
jgi:hypothetical protein